MARSKNAKINSNQGARGFRVRVTLKRSKYYINTSQNDFSIFESQLNEKNCMNTTAKIQKKKFTRISE